MRACNHFLPSGTLVFASVALLALGTVCAQTPATAPTAAAPSAASSAPPLVVSAAEQSVEAAPVSEDQLREQLQGKTFYLRRGYLGDSLHFKETGALDGTAPEASYTLSLVQIERVRLKKHRLELECTRYGLHFPGALATEDQTQAVDRVRLTSKKKPLKITIDREQVSKPKKEKESKSGKHRHGPEPGTRSNIAADADNASAPGSADPASDTARPSASATSQAHANLALANALDHVFAAAIDQRMVATLPDYWTLFYQAAAAHQLYRPADPGIFRQADVDQKARLVSMSEPQSNEYAQKNGVAGMAMYSVVVGGDGRAQQVAVARPIGFGLDENAVAAINKATFQPAMKDGKPVAVFLDVLVQFRIYSKRTAEVSAITPALPKQPDAPALPGPYTAIASQPQSQTATDSGSPAQSAQPQAQPGNPAADSQPAAQPAPAPTSQPKNAPQ